MSVRSIACILILLELVLVVSALRFSQHRSLTPIEPIRHRNGTRWAVLIAGSAGYWNYRHQADVCHAYQILRRGGMKEENIIVFMFDDIARSMENPRPGVLINHPEGDDVYAGVPKDYTGAAVNVQNLFAVLLGDRDAVRGGSGKVLATGPHDHVFIFYSDHGGPGVLGMPVAPYLYAVDLVRTLKEMHSRRRYKEMVIYLEACESGSIFEGLLPENFNIFVTTASNAFENSWGTYCPGLTPPPPPEYDTCLGDLYSVSWMEDSETHNLDLESLKDQYRNVKLRTSDSNTYKMGSHVMQYGDVCMIREKLSLYFGNDPDNANLTGTFPSLLLVSDDHSNGPASIGQRDADLLHFWQKYKNCKENSLEKGQALQTFLDVMARRTHIDKSVELIGKILFNSPEVSRRTLDFQRPQGQQLVDDWDCLKQMVRIFEAECGALGQYGMKHMRAFANICNARVVPDKMKSAAGATCGGIAYYSRYYHNNDDHRVAEPGPVVIKQGHASY